MSLENDFSLSTGGAGEIGKRGGEYTLAFSRLKRSQQSLRDWQRIVALTRMNI